MRIRIIIVLFQLLSLSMQLNAQTRRALVIGLGEQQDRAWGKINGDRSSIDYWEKAKQEALTESKKNDIFIDGINAKLEIIEKYRK